MKGAGLFSFKSFPYHLAHAEAARTKSSTVRTKYGPASREVAHASRFKTCNRSSCSSIRIPEDPQRGLSATSKQ